MTRLVLAALCFPLVSCIAYNAECSPPIEEPDFVVAHLSAPVPVGRAVVRIRESGLANAMTDAYLAALQGFSPRPVVAIENAGAIREAGICVTRTQLGKGPLTRLVLRDTVPFSNELVVVELTERQLFDVLEHGVNTLSVPGLVPGGQFLQVSGLTYEVDCKERPEKLAPGADQRLVRQESGRRVRAITLGSRRITRDEASDSTRIVVAVNDFIASGGDNFLDFAGSEVVPSGQFTYTVLETHLGRIGPSAERPAVLSPDPQNPRIVLSDCE